MPVPLGRPIIPGKGRTKGVTMRTILIATDGSVESREAVEYGLAVAAEQDASAILLQVIPPIDWTTLDRGAVIRPIPFEIERRRGIALDEAAALARNHGVPVSFEVVAGDPAGEIVTYADNHDVAQIQCVKRPDPHIPRIGLHTLSLTKRSPFRQGPAAGWIRARRASI